MQNYSRNLFTPIRCLFRSNFLKNQFSTSKFAFPKPFTSSAAAKFELPRELESAIEEKATESRRRAQVLKVQYKDTVCDKVTIKSLLGERDLKEASYETPPNELPFFDDCNGQMHMRLA